MTEPMMSLRTLVEKTPARNSCATCRLNATLWDRCLAMAFILRKPGSPCQLILVQPSGPRGPLQDGLLIARLSTQMYGRANIDLLRARTIGAA